MTTRFERWYFSSNLLSAFACSFIASLAAFAWLRTDPLAGIEIPLELAACAIFGIDIYLSRKDHAAFLRSPLGILIVTLSVTPWYALATLVFPSSQHPIYVMLAHASFIPYLMMRYQFLDREHIVPRYVKVAFGVIVFLFVMHWLATAWMLLQPRTNVDFLTEYNMAFYYLMTTISTIGYGDITPTDNASRMFAMVLQVMGVCIFGLVIGQLARVIMNADRRKERVKEEMDALVALVKHYEIPSDLQKKSYRFMRHLLNSSSNEDELRVLSRLPQGLQNEIRCFMNAKPLSKVSIFKNCSQKCLLDAASELRQEFFTPGQKIIQKGEVGTSMFLIGHGTVRIHAGDHVIAELDDGQCFGEMALINREVRQADVSAVSDCDIFVLSQDRFDHLIENHFDLRRNVNELAEQRVQKKAS